MLFSDFEDYSVIAGCDEAGRGCLAGPVFAAAVILPLNLEIQGLDDSKKLSEKQRYKLRDVIIDKALSYNVASVDNLEIDATNILKASITAMHRALDGLKISPEIILVDGNKFYEYNKIPYRCIIKGDGLYSCIAAASVLAKTFRDDYMQQIDKEYPVYLWKQNKGYPTQAHTAAIIEHGYSPYHRKTFAVPTQLKLF